MAQPNGKPIESDPTPAEEAASNDASADGASGAEVLVVARLNARLQPLDRYEHFEKPLDALLGATEIGEVVGGGTMLAEDGGAAFCEIEVALAGDDARFRTALTEALDQLGAPKGSKLLVYADDSAEDPVDETSLGVREGLALFVNGVDLPDEVYASHDIDDVIDEIESRLGETGKYLSHAVQER
ncbi:MAG: hypothetical protein AAF850_12690, partial [Pseudomonadota bacterium]